MSGARDVTRDLRRRVAARYGRTGTAVGMPEHRVLFEVPVDDVARGREKRRRIDAVAVGLWASTEHLVHGFEIKATRADLRRELADPEKSMPARRLCDRWWLVLASLDLLRDDPVPDEWGVLVAHGRGLRVHIDAGPQYGVPDRRFLAALVQTATRGTGTVARGLGYVDGVNRGYKLGHDRGAAEARKEAARDRIAAGSRDLADVAESLSPSWAR